MKTNKISLKKEIKHLHEAIFMKCLDCSCYQPTEIIDCKIKVCPLWEERPKETRGLYSLTKKLKQKSSRFFEAKE